MATKTLNDLLWGHPVALIDPVGTVPTTDPGYLDEDTGVSIKISNEQGTDRVAELDGAVISRTLSRSCGFTLAFKQYNAETLARALGVPYVSGDLELSIGAGIIQSPKLNARIIGTLEDGKPIHIYFPRCVVGSEVTIDLKRKDPNKLMVDFNALDSSAGMVKKYIGRTVQSATIATGTFARTQETAAPKGIAWVKMSGEGAAADALTDITGSGPSLTDGELIRLQLTTTAQVITVTHGSGVIETKTGTNFVMTHLEDWIDLYYDATATAWKELARYDAF